MPLAATGLLKRTASLRRHKCAKVGSKERHNGGDCLKQSLVQVLIKEIWYYSLSRTTLGKLFGV